MRRLVGMLLRKDVKVEMIKKVPLFSRCSRKQLEEIAAIADEIDLEEGRELIRQGEPGREFFVLISGTVEATRDGRHLQSLTDGDFFGEIALVSDEPRTATVIATTPLRSLVITDRAFRTLLERSPDIEASVREAVLERTSHASDSDI